MTPLDYGRLLFAFTLAVHALFLIVGIGLAFFISLAEFWGIRRKDEDYLRMARTWSRGFVVLFAVGAGTGVSVAVELYLLWPTFMAAASQVIILPFFIEVFAFFVETIFLGIYMYTWGRFRNPYHHWLASVPVAVASAASGFLITTVNAFMNAPAGFDVVAGQIVNVDPVAAMLNPAVPIETSHTLVACYAGTAFLLAAIYAWKRLRGDAGAYATRAFRLAISVGLITAILAAIGGSLSASFVAMSQPEKFAAMEGLYVTQARAPEVFFGITIPIPGLLSFLATGSFDGVVTGLDAFPSSTWPDVALVHTAFNLLVTVGIVLVLLAAANVLADRVPRLERLRRLSLYAAVAGGPLAYANFELGWIVTEVGRQPWIIQDVMTTAQGFTAASDAVPGLFAAFVAFYAVLLAATVLVLRRLYAERPREPRIVPGVSHG